MKFLLVVILLAAGCSNDRSTSAINPDRSTGSQVDPVNPIEPTEKDFETAEDFLKKVEVLNGTDANDCRSGLVESILEQAMITGTKNIADVLDQALKITIESNVNGICTIERNPK